MIVHGADAMDRIFPARRITVLSYSLSYSPLAVSRCGGDQMPSELVGVAGFEPAASSSEAKYRRALPAASHAWPAPDRPWVSADVRRRPWRLSLTSSLSTESTSGRQDAHTHGSGVPSARAYD